MYPARAKAHANKLRDGSTARGGSWIGKMASSLVVLRDGITRTRYSCCDRVTTLEQEWGHPRRRCPELKTPVFSAGTNSRRQQSKSDVRFSRKN
jgi:hypothetical protein